MSKLTVAKNLVTSRAARTVLKTQKHSPVILFAAGTIGVVSTVVMASKATLKLDEVLTESETLREKAQLKFDEDLPSYTQADMDSDLKKIKARTTLNVIKLYTPTVVVGALSICALGGSHVILTKRNTAVTASYIALDQAFKEYRERVAGVIGEDEERKLRLETNTETIGEGKNAEEVTNFKKGVHPYVALFDEHTTDQWSKEPEYNLTVLRTAQMYANDRLRARGHLFLNEVLESLGLRHTKAGAVCGWVYNNDKGDQRVDFGVFQDKERFHEFMSDRHGAIWLDFNCDGPILDMI